MWIYNSNSLKNEDIPKDAVGFIYLITNTKTNQFYIGRKLLWSKKSRQVKGKKVSSTVPSNWQDYWSSSPIISEDIKENGKDHYKREVLFFAYGKGALIYGEEKALYVLGALETDKCINNNIRSKVYRSWVKNKIDPRMNDTLDQIKSSLSSSSSS